MGIETRQTRIWVPAFAGMTERQEHPEEKRGASDFFRQCCNYRVLGLAVWMLWACVELPAQAQTNSDWAWIENLTVSPRRVAESASDAFDLVSTGQNTVGVSKTVYLQASANPTAPGPVIDFVWNVTLEPSPGAAAVDTQTSSLLKLRLTAPGAYTISLTPIDEANQPQAAATVSLWAARYAGASGGTLKCTTCHAPETNLWKTTRHATFLQDLLNGVYQTPYDTRCLACHTVGSFADTRGDNNFLDKAESIAFDLNQIVTWVEDAAATGNQNYSKLPKELQTLAGIQCESCHGPGDTHMGDSAKIAPGELSGRACAVCHDGTGEYVRFAQWENSGHILANTSAGGSVATNASCVACHTAEGFVELTVRGNGAIDAKYLDRNAVTCSACHDSHDPAHPAQLRTVSAVTLPNQSVYDRGTGNICANCHNSRIASADAAVDLVTGSYRGAHHGPQTDVFLGTSAYTWGNPYPAGQGTHYGLIADGCVPCHTAKAAEPSSTVGDHTFQINNSLTGASTASSACGGCHAGLTTTDRVPLSPQDYDGNGAAEGIQTETRGILENLKTELLARLPGVTWDAEEERLSISNADWQNLNLDQRAALYNFNLISEDKSEGIHNTDYSLAVLQRSYFHLTGTVYSDAFPDAVMVDDDLGVTTNLPAPLHVNASDGTFTDRVEVTWDTVERATHYRVFRALSPSDVFVAVSDWITTQSFTDPLAPTSGTVSVTTYYYRVQAAADANGKRAGELSDYDAGWIASGPDNPLNQYYEVTARDCTLTLETATGDGLILDMPEVASNPAHQKKGTLKIRRLKKKPSGALDTVVVTTPTQRVLLYCPTISRIQVGGPTDLSQFYTEAPVKTLSSTVGVAELTAQGCVVEEVSARGWVRVKMTATPNSLASPTPEVANTRMGSRGTPYKKATVALKGIRLQGVDAEGQFLDSVRVETKKNRLSGRESFLSVGDIEGETFRARSIRSVLVVGGAMRTDEIWTLNGPSTVQIEARSGFFEVGRQGTASYHAVLRRGDALSRILDVKASKLNVIAQGGDVKPTVLLTSGALANVTARFRKVRTGGATEYVGGRVGLESSDLTTTASQDRYRESLAAYFTTTTLADMATSGSVFVSGLSAVGSVGSSLQDIQTISGDKGIQGIFLAGATAQVSFYGVSREIAPNLQGLLRKMKVRKPGPYGTPMIAGESWANPSQKTQFVGDTIHSGFIQHSSAPGG